jgi:hypothetical protein
LADWLAPNNDKQQPAMVRHVQHRRRQQATILIVLAAALIVLEAALAMDQIPYHVSTYNEEDSEQVEHERVYGKSE